MLERQPIAVVATACWFPGSRDLDSFFYSTLQPQCPAQQVSQAHWQPMMDGTQSSEDRLRHGYGYLLEDLPRNGGLDSLFQLTAEVTTQLMNQVAVKPAPQRIGMVTGSIALPTTRSAQGFAGLDSHITAAPTWLAARSSGIEGRVYSLDAACASSLYALGLACLSLWRGEADLMVAGGVSLADRLFTQMGFQQLQALSPSGVARPLSEGGDGLLVGEGCGLVALRRLEDAQRNGEPILGVIHNVGISSDVGGGLLAPQSSGQLRAMQQAYQGAQSVIEPSWIDYVECHATGTPLGDKVEVSSLGQLLGPNQAVLSSLKGAVGHLLTAAGAASLLRVLGAFHHKILPNQPGLQQPLSGIEKQGHRVLVAPEPWLEPKVSNSGGSRFAAINGFGFGGINAHVILQEAPRLPPSAPWHSIAASQPKASGAEPVHLLADYMVCAGGDEQASGSLAAVEFAPGTLRIPPHEVACMSRQQTWALHAALEVMGRAGLDWQQPLEAAGVFVGIEHDGDANRFNQRWQQLQTGQVPTAAPALSRAHVLGSLGGITASRIARELRFGGCGFTVSSDETSGLEALRLAVESVAEGRLQLAVVVAVDICAGYAGTHSLGAQNFMSAHQNGPAGGIADGVAAVLVAAPEVLASRGCTSLGQLSLQPLGESRTISLTGTRYHGAATGLVRLVDSWRQYARRREPAWLQYTLTDISGGQVTINSRLQAVASTQTKVKGDLELQLPPAHMIHAAQCMEHQVHEQQLLSSADGLLSPAAREPFNSEPAQFDYAACRRFATGSIAEVLGERFAPIDGFPKRVRLPDGPLLLCHRILSIEGTPLSMAKASMVTEHDVHPDAYYLEQGQVPVAIAVEAGQADLFLSAFLGADFATKGEAVYRLLDAEIMFHDRLPEAGDTIRYEIAIKEFFQQSGILFFRFEFDASVDGQPLMSMRQGCAGFFNEQQLAAGKGVKEASLALASATNETRQVPEEFQQVEQPISLNQSKVEALRCGDYAGAFGDRFSEVGSRLSRPQGLPTGMMALVQRISRLVTVGGRFGYGEVVGEADIASDAWFLRCHFVDDEVMPGTLMYECCLQTLRVYLMRLGWVGEQEEMSFQPVPGVVSRLKCRGQVLATTRTVTYRIMPKELGYNEAGEAYVICDALMLADGRPIVHIGSMSLFHPGYTKTRLQQLWPQAPRPEFFQAPFSSKQVTALAVGELGAALGKAYEVFDGGTGRYHPRLPGEPFLFLDRVPIVSTPPGQMVQGGSIEGSYQVPQKPWYYEEAAGDSAVPFCVLLEIPLQVCGFYASYMGAALTTGERLRFRNLGGGICFKGRVLPGMELVSRITCTSVAQSGALIIMEFTFEVWGQLEGGESELMIEGDTSFGFFTDAAMAAQVGIRGVESFQVPSGDIGGLDPSLVPADKRLLMVDRICHEDPLGGPAGLGMVLGEKSVVKSDWYFQAHFFQDPVMPGSLGLETFVQLVKHLAVKRWGARAAGELSLVVENVRHRWQYRGQVVPSNQRVQVCVSITEVGKGFLEAEGLLQVDGLVIYRMNGFRLVRKPAE